LDTLKATAPSRIVNVSSVAHIERRGKGGKIFFDDFNFEKQPYDREVAYSQSKLANILHASELARRLEGTGVSVFSAHPRLDKIESCKACNARGCFYTKYRNETICTTPWNNVPI
ncbi:MAG: hypothetical protein ACXAD7_14025, partial [Candidatus Kariarchaeaceae archaeon]